MLNYRSNNFIEFFLDRKSLPFFYGLIPNIVVVILIVSYVLTTLFEKECRACIFLLLCIIIFKIGISVVYYKNYKKGRIIFEKAKKYKDFEIVENIDVYAKGFDLFERKDFFQVKNITIYEFESCDLILANESILILGKSDIFYSTSYAIPVEISKGDFNFGCAAAELIKWKIKADKLWIEINDYTFKNPFWLRFNLNQTEKLVLYLEENFDNLKLKGSV